MVVDFDELLLFRAFETAFGASYRLNIKTRFHLNGHICNRTAITKEKKRRRKMCFCWFTVLNNFYVVNLSAFVARTFYIFCLPRFLSVFRIECRLRLRPAKHITVIKIPTEINIKNTPPMNANTFKLPARRKKEKVENELKEKKVRRKDHEKVFIIFNKFIANCKFHLICFDNKNIETRRTFYVIVVDTYRIPMRLPRNKSVNRCERIAHCRVHTEEAMGCRLPTPIHT